MPRSSVPAFFYTLSHPLTFVDVIFRNARAMPFPWSTLVSLLGLAYFLAWSLSFYPQVLLNYRRKRTDGFSPDFAYLNPLGFLALSIWNGGMMFSSVAREQYAARHEGHEPQIAGADLAFSVHALAVSMVMFGQVFWYRRRTIEGLSAGAETKSTPIDGTATRVDDETDPLLAGSRDTTHVQDPVVPSIPGRFALGGTLLAAAVSTGLLWAGKIEWLDWLYLISAIKLFVSSVKWIPQIMLNWRLRRVEGMAIHGITMVRLGSLPIWPL